jgi:putative ABC transport system permease protein
MGLLGGVVGIAAGVLVAKPFVDNISAQAEQAAGIHLSVHVTAFAVAAGLTLGVATSLMATVRPAWRLRRMDVSSELADRPVADEVTERVPVARIALMSAVVVLGLVAGWISQRNGALEPWQPPLAVAALAVAGTIVFRLPAALAPALFGALRRLPLLQQGAARVALGSLTAQPRRVAAATLAVGAAVGLSVGIGNADLAAGSRTLADATAEGRVFVSTLRPNNTTTIDAKIPPALAARLAEFPGVAGIERHYHTAIDHPLLGATALEGTDGAPPTFEVIKGRTYAEAAARGEVMVGPALARSLRLDPEDTFTVPGRDRLVELRVGGIWKAPDNIGRSISAPYSVFRELAGPQPPDSMLLVPSDDLDAGELASRVRAADLDPRLNVFDPAELGTRYAEDFGDFVQPFRIIQRGLLGVAFVATASTLLLAALQRRREHGLLMALGMPPAGLARMVLIEAGLIGLAGTAFGWVSGVVGGQLFVFASPVVTGLEVPLTLSVLPVVTAGVLAIGFVLAGAALPAWRTSRLDPMVALRYE